MSGSVNAQTHTGQMLPLAPSLTPSRSVPVPIRSSEDRWMWIKTSGDSTNETWIPTRKLRLGRSGRARFFLLRSFLGLGCLHFHIFRCHRVGDVSLVADLHVAVDLGVGIAIHFPAVLALLHNDHRIVYFKDWPGDFISLRAGKRHAAEHQTRRCDQTKYFCFHRLID